MFKFIINILFYLSKEKILSCSIDWNAITLDLALIIKISFVETVNLKVLFVKIFDMKIW